MKVQDYEYYEAHAKDVKLEDITSDDHNAEILARLRDNDPELKYIAIIDELSDYCDFVIREDDQLGWLGYFVGKSKHLDTLCIEDFPDNINLNALFRGLGHNRSIERLHFSKDPGESFQSLIPFVRDNDSLRDLGFGGFDMGLQCARNIAMLLSQNSFLKCLDLDETIESSLKHLYFEEISLDDEGLMEVVTALRVHTQIEVLTLAWMNNVSRNGFMALGRMLEGWRNPILKKIDLHNSNVDDGGLCALVAGLKNCHNLTSLNLSMNEMITEAGFRSLSTLFHSDNCRLEHLNVFRMNIGDDEAAVLATGLASLPSLKKLDLSSISIGDRGIQDLVRGLVTCALEELEFHNNVLSESISGLRSLGTLVRTTNMRSLNLSDCSLTDEGLQSLVEGMANCCSLTKLSFSGNRSITGNGLRSFAPIFSSDNCCMEELVLLRMNTGDDGAVALANGLRGNKSLKTLRFIVSHITVRGWAAFSRLLCDTSSLNNTYLSNNTLQHVGSYYDMPDTHQDVVKYLKLNKLQKQAAAICKILHSYPDFDVTPLFQFNLKCLPLVVKRLEKAKPYLEEVNESSEAFKNRQLSALYKFIRGMPLVAANGYRSQKMNDVQLQSKSKKRKLDQTL